VIFCCVNQKKVADAATGSIAHSWQPPLSASTASTTSVRARAHIVGASVSLSHVIATLDDGRVACLLLRPVAAANNVDVNAPHVIASWSLVLLSLMPAAGEEPRSIPTALSSNGAALASMRESPNVSMQAHELCASTCAAVAVPNNSQTAKRALIRVSTAVCAAVKVA
jgi:hypothetical protein